MTGPAAVAWQSAAILCGALGAYALLATAAAAYLYAQARAHRADADRLRAGQRDLRRRAADAASRQHAAEAAATMLAAARATPAEAGVVHLEVVDTASGPVPVWRPGSLPALAAGPPVDDPTRITYSTGHDGTQ